MTQSITLQFLNKLAIQVQSESVKVIYYLILVQ
jgi:hypothetical protein